MSLILVSSMYYDTNELLNNVLYTVFIIRQNKKKNNERSIDNRLAYSYSSLLFR